MSATFYGPNKLKSGGAAFASINIKDECSYIQFIKQTDWNEEAKTGSFLNGERLNLKLSQDEICELIRAVRTKGLWKFYHSNDSDPTTGQFSYYQIKDEATKLVKREGFGFSVKRGTVEIKVGLTNGAALHLALYMENGLKHIFDADMQKDIQERIEYAKNRANKVNTTSTTKQTVEEKVVTPTDDINTDDAQPDTGDQEVF